MGVLAVARLLDRKYVAAAALLMFGMVIHPLMGAFAVCFCVLLFWMERSEIPQATLAGILPLGLLDPPTPAYHPIALSHSYFYLLRWEWYEWLGVIGPLLLLCWFVRIARFRQMRNLELISRALIHLPDYFLDWRFGSFYPRSGLRPWHACSPCAAFSCCTSCLCCLPGV